MSTTANIHPRLVKCRRPSDLVHFWQFTVAGSDGFDHSAESFWIITLNDRREILKVFAPATKAFGDTQRFADEVFSEVFLRYAKEIALIHFRPGITPKPGQEDIQRVRALILAGHAKGIQLIDAVIVGKPGAENPSGCFSYHQPPGFEPPLPFSDMEAVK